MMDGLEMMLKAVVVLKGINEVVLLTLLGQGALWLLAGSQRHGNLIYGAFSLVCSRVLRLFRAVTPRRVPDRLMPLVAVLWLLLIEALLILAKIALYAETVLRAHGIAQNL